MFEISIRDEFSAAHQLRYPGGVTEKLHGHNWKVEVVVRSGGLDGAGLVMDFGDLREATRKVLWELDVSLLNELEPFLEQSPSTENLARYIFDRLSSMVEGKGRRLSRVTVWEADNRSATYSED